LDKLRALVVATIIYLGPLLIGAAPLLILYWLYQPTVLMNPGFAALTAPAAMALWLGPGPPESRDDVGTSTPTALAGVAEDFDQTESTTKKRKSSSDTGGSDPIVGRRASRLSGGAGKRESAHNVSAALTNPGEYTGMSRSAASSYAYTVNQSGRYRW
jgi:hypothetical protein